MKKYDSRVDPNGIMSILHFIQIRQAVLEFNHADGRIDRHGQLYMHTFSAHRENKAYKLNKLIYITINENQSHRECNFAKYFIKVAYTFPLLCHEELYPHRMHLFP
jgi:hypothetical protein